MNKYEMEQLADAILKAVPRKDRDFLSAWQMKSRRMREVSISNLPKKLRQAMTNRFESRCDDSD